jgi:hypothetical protein
MESITFCSGTMLWLPGKAYSRASRSCGSSCRIPRQALLFSDIPPWSVACIQESRVECDSEIASSWLDLGIPFHLFDGQITCCCRDQPTGRSAVSGE